MRAVSLLMFLMALTLGNATSAAVEKAPPLLNQSKVFLTTYCISCHGNEKTKGDHNFETFSDKDWNDQDLLDDLLTVLTEKEMPPEKAKKKPSAKEVAAFEKLLIKQYQTVNAKLPGVLTRLNRAEYENTINDVFSTKMLVKNSLPVDNTREGFDNEGDKLFMSPFAMDSYFRSASEIAEQVVGARPEASTTVYSYPTNGVRVFHGAYKENNDKLLQKGEMFGKLYNESVSLGFGYDLRKTGHYDVKVNGHFTGKHPHKSKLPELDPELKAEVGKKNERLNISTHIDYQLSKEAFSFQEFLLSEKVRVYVELGQHVVVQSHNYTHPLPKDISALTRIPPLPKHKKLAEITRTLLNFESAEITGPYYESWPPENDFYNTYYEGLKGRDPRQQYREFVEKLATRLFRRPVSDKDLKRYYDIANTSYDVDKNVFNAVQSALKVMLCSPNFLYKYKRDVRELDDYAIASRLSYLLWNSLPDDRLLKLASEGKLKDSSVRSAEALRMLQDPKSQRFAADFTTQWLELHKIDFVNPDNDLLHYSFRDQRGAKISRLKPFFMQESIEFFKLILNENLSLLNFIDSDFVVINQPLNEIYKVKLPEVELLPNEANPKDSKQIAHEKTLRLQMAFRKVMLDKESPRGGLLTQPGILMMTTNGKFTNPFYRGAWVAKNVYGLELSVPANLDIGALQAPTETFTIKDSINEHRKDPACASCHSKMDPFGLAMENFDVFGRWRDTYSKFILTKTTIEKTAEGKTKKTEKTEGKYEPTTKVESDTVHRDGRPIDGMKGLKKLMLEDKDEIAKNLLTKLSQYALGRRMNYADSERLQGLLEVSKKNDYKLRDLMVSIIADESFTKR